MDDNYLTVVDEDGSEILCEILFTFDSDDSDKSYVFYIPVETNDDDDEDIEVLCSSYTEQEDGSIGELKPIENDDEWDMVEEVFNTYVSSEDDEDDEEDDDCCCGHNHQHDENDEDCCCDHNHEKK